MLNLIISKISRLVPKRIREILQKAMLRFIARQRVSMYSLRPPNGEFVLVCKSVGVRCGIAQQSKYLKERLNASVVPSSRLVKNRKDMVIIEFEPTFYSSPAELWDEVRHASRISNLVLLDCHQISPWLTLFSRSTIICVKSVDVAATSGLHPVSVAGLLMPDLKVEHKPPPSEIILGCFGFAFPAKNFHKVIQLANRLGAKVKVITSVNNAAPNLEALSKQYLSNLKSMANRNVEIIEVFGKESEILAHLQDCSHIVFAEEFEGTVSASMRLAALSGRPVMAINTRQAREAGAILMDSLDDITVDFLKNCANTRITVSDGFGDYAKIIGGFLLAPLYSRIGHPDSIYEDSRQKERIRWLKNNGVGRIVDVGCASGYVTDYIGAELGVDSRQDRIAYATLRYPRIKFKLLDARKHAVRGFDTVVFGEIVEHMAYEEALQMITLWAGQEPKRILLTTPNADKEDFDPAWVQNPEHKWMPTRTKVEKLVTNGYCSQLGMTSGGDFWLLRMDRVQ